MYYVVVNPNYIYAYFLMSSAGDYELGSYFNCLTLFYELIKIVCFY